LSLLGVGARTQESCQACERSIPNYRNVPVRHRFRIAPFTSRQPDRRDGARLPRQSTPSCCRYFSYRAWLLNQLNLAHAPSLVEPGLRVGPRGGRAYSSLCRGWSAPSLPRGLPAAASGRTRHRSNRPSWSRQRCLIRVLHTEWSWLKLNSFRSRSGSQLDRGCDETECEIALPCSRQ
jgi:hypothetical protein